MTTGGANIRLGGDSGGESGLTGHGVLGGLIDVRPKVLHSNVAGQDMRKSHHGKAKDNIQTVIGTEKIMIQSKPRGNN